MTITWTNGAIAGEWLETTIADSLTGTADVFYYGNVLVPQRDFRVRVLTNPTVLPRAYLVPDARRIDKGRQAEVRRAQRTYSSPWICRMSVKARVMAGRRGSVCWR